MKCVIIGKPPSSINLTPAQPNRYNIGVHYESLKRTLSKIDHLRVGDRLSVTFTPQYKGARLPDPKLLTLHAVCAWVGHMSGAAKAIGELERDAEETSVLARDGSSARLLDHLMIPLQ